MYLGVRYEHKTLRIANGMSAHTITHNVINDTHTSTLTFSYPYSTVETIACFPNQQLASAWTTTSIKMDRVVSPKFFGGITIQEHNTTHINPYGTNLFNDWFL